MPYSVTVELAHRHAVTGNNDLDYFARTGAWCLAICMASCNQTPLPGGGGGSGGEAVGRGVADMACWGAVICQFPVADLTYSPTGTGEGDGPDACLGPTLDPSCIDIGYGPQTSPFSLQGDVNADPTERDSGMTRDRDGYLAIDLAGTAHGAALTSRYSLIVKGCQDTDGNATDTEWHAVLWDADVPPRTSLLVHARSANAANAADASWSKAAWTTEAPWSPLDMRGENEAPGSDGYLQVEFIFKTNDETATPRLRSFHVGFKCSDLA